MSVMRPATETNRAAHLMPTDRTRKTISSTKTVLNTTSVYHRLAGIIEKPATKLSPRHDRSEMPGSFQLFSIVQLLSRVRSLMLANGPRAS